MKIIVFGATGEIGHHVVAQARRRGHTITAVARSRRRLEELEGSLTRQAADLMADPDAARRLIPGHDAAISTLRPATGAEMQLVALTRAVLSGAASADVPVFVTGGAATLKLRAGEPASVLNTPGFLPEAVRPIAEACAAQDALLDVTPDARWYCLRPPAMLVHGPGTGDYQWGTDTLVSDAEGISRISYADFASAMLDLVETGHDRHPRRLTVGWQRVPN
ncbi:NAD(P)-dependent oxidoreductase [Modicisalibacter coralii]|uniref:NAD(P)-dependent oxidoreductase n=1 Tax=Modicisalibacter coralii TaxID=2304602 RepID=UPI00100AD555|nr:NAD(P)H-binding protein [Halomonas coralii]